MYKLLVILLLVLPGSNALKAQSPSIEDILKTRREMSDSFLQRLPSIQTIVEEVPEAEKLVFVARRVKELLPPDRERILAEVIQKDGRFKKSYYVRIGDAHYIRPESGEWQQIDEREFSGPIAGARVSATYEFAGTETVAGITVDVFRVKTWFSYGKDPQGGNESTYYFDKNNFLRRSVIVTFGRNGTTRKITSDFRYPESLNIEAPIK